MFISLYDFDTQSAPFEGFASCTPFAPVVLFAMLSAPAYWWANAWLSFYGGLPDAMVSAMTYPFETRPVASGSTAAPQPTTHQATASA